MKNFMRTYVIARMYSGSYIDSKLGGEAINLLHDDNGNNYIFVGPVGFIDKQYDNTVEGVILTRIVKDGRFEVLGFAKMDKNSQVIYHDGSSVQNRINKAKEILDKYAEENKITYDGVSLKDIHGGAFEGADITFKSKELLLPNGEIFISDSEHKDFKVEGAAVVNLSDVRFPRTSLHSYITDTNNKKAFDAVTKMIENDSLWEKGRINKIVEGQKVDKHFNLLNIIKKDYDELTYSNFMAYVFKTYEGILAKFCNEILKVGIDINFTIERETKNNIDLWIEDHDDIIVIENKIKSGINGVSARHDFSEGGLVQSQLLKYYEYTEAVKGNKNAHYFIFVPDYNKIDLSKYSGSQYYKVIKYSELYEFFKKIDIDDVYFKEFVNALYIHTKNREIDYAEDMAYRFLNQIKKNKHFLYRVDPSGGIYRTGANHKYESYNFKTNTWHESDYAREVFYKNQGTHVVSESLIDAEIERQIKMVEEQWRMYNEKNKK